jgi:hypothetical protein
MQPPMIGSWTIAVQGARPFTIHGDEYFELHAVRTNDPQSQPFSLKIPRHALSEAPAAGQVLLVKFLMGQVTEAKPVNRPG